MYEATFVATNREDWIEDGALYDTNNAPIDLTSAGLTFAVNDRCGVQRLLATVGDGISLITCDGNNEFEISFTSGTMRNLEPAVYNVGLTVTLNSVVTQLLVGTVEIIDGVVP